MNEKKNDKMNQMWSQYLCRKKESLNIIGGDNLIRYDLKTDEKCLTSGFYHALE